MYKNCINAKKECIIYKKVLERVLITRGFQVFRVVEKINRPRVYGSGILL